MKTIGENEAAQTAKGKATCRSKANIVIVVGFV